MSNDVKYLTINDIMGDDFHPEEDAMVSIPYALNPREEMILDLKNLELELTIIKHKLRGVDIVEVSKSLEEECPDLRRRVKKKLKEAYELDTDVASLVISLLAKIDKTIYDLEVREDILKEFYTAYNLLNSLKDAPDYVLKEITTEVAFRACGAVDIIFQELKGYRELIKTDFKADKDIRNTMQIMTAFIKDMSPAISRIRKTVLHTTLN